MMEDLHSIANFLAGVRECLTPILDGEIRRGNACIAKGDLVLEPGLRKTTLADARKIAEGMRPKLNRAIEALFAMDLNAAETDVVFLKQENESLRADLGFALNRVEVLEAKQDEY